VGRPEWRPERGITDNAVEAQAQAMISQPQRVKCPRRERAARRGAVLPGGEARGGRLREGGGSVLLRPACGITRGG